MLTFGPAAGFKRKIYAAPPPRSTTKTTIDQSHAQLLAGSGSLNFSSGVFLKCDSDPNVLDAPSLPTPVFAPVFALDRLFASSLPLFEADRGAAPGPAPPP